MPSDKPVASQAPQPAFSSPPRDSTEPTPERIGAHYAVQEVLGRGGMGTVYRVLETASGRELALKQLQLPSGSTASSSYEQLFEQEFRTLRSLSHPRVIRVYDYGLDPRGAYYTMELLSGESLFQAAPLDWRQACTLMHDVCSSLALLHSRRLVHRDVSPHNVRRDKDGRAKLIDFGAMAQMGRCQQIVGTPAFTAPEAVHRLALDARTDLFSVGATLYFALTGRVAFSARSFAQLADIWVQRPRHVSELVPAVPPALAALVMALLSFEPGLRPRSAADVMQQLAMIAELDQHEDDAVSAAYLDTPALVGREALLAEVKQRLARARTGRGSVLLLQGAPGSGRSRALDASVLEAKLLGAVTVRAGTDSGDRQPFALARTLTAQLLESLPEACAELARTDEQLSMLWSSEPSITRTDGALTPSSDAPLLRSTWENISERQALQAALSRLWLQLAGTYTLVIGADDVERGDEASCAWLAMLSDRAKRGRLLLLLTAPDALPADDPRWRVIAQRSTRVELQALDRTQTQQLVESLFGDVPNLALVSERIYRSSGGNPRACMELAQHLAEAEHVCYVRGRWTLPPQLDERDLPSSMDQALGVRLLALSPAARALAKLHALSVYAALSIDDQARLMASLDADATAARQELLASGIVSGDGVVFRLHTDAWRAVLRERLDDDAERTRLHRALAELGLATRPSEFATAHHLLRAGLDESALDIIAQRLSTSADRQDLLFGAQMPSRELAQLFTRALSAAERVNRSAREIAELQRWLYTLAVIQDEVDYAPVGAAWLARLQHDSGADDWRQLSDVSDPSARVVQALQRAAQRWQDTAEAGRGYAVDEAIRLLVHYVVVSIGVGARTFDVQLLRRYSEVLVPFVGLSPLLEIMQQNALAGLEAGGLGQVHRARERWRRVLTRLNELQGDVLRYRDNVHYGIAFAIGSLEAARGYASAQHWAQLLDNSGLQHATDALYLRKLISLQQGDFEAAQRYQRRAELRAVQAGTPQLFTGTLVMELSAHALASDRSGVRQIGLRIHSMAERFPGWQVYAHLADGYEALLCGAPEKARTLLERALSQCEPQQPQSPYSITPWPAVAGAYIQALRACGQLEQACAFGRRTLELCERLDVMAHDDVVRALALAEAEFGQQAVAAERVRALLERQLQGGVAGLHLGASYETRARIALLAADAQTFEHFSKLTALEYHHGCGSALGVRYEQMLEQARQHGQLEVAPELTQFETNLLRKVPDATTQVMRVAEAAVRAVDRRERAAMALRMLCEAAGATAGQLYLVQPEAELRLAASLGSRTADPNDQVRARDSLRQVLQDELCTSEWKDGSTAMSHLASAAVRTASGDRSFALLLTAVAQGQVRHVAVALVFGVSSASVPGTTLALRDMLAEQLLAAGDTSGVIGPA